MMKKWFGYVVAVVISLIITFLLFEIMSWYHFGDNPTKIVLIRLIACFCLLSVLLISIIAFVNKKK